VASAPASRLPRGHLFAALLAAVILIAAASAIASLLVWNLSASLPRGLYRRESGVVPRRGEVVCFPPPPAAAALIAERAYLPPGTSLLKVIVALPGDRVCIDDVSFTANGEYFGPVARYDSAGRDLAPFRFCGVVPAGSAFVATRASLSFDSRYFGPVPLSSVNVVVPLWTY
jgi:conjugative transfer signal peptidase TraF